MPLPGSPGGGRRAASVLVAALPLFGFWLLLSGKTDLFHLALGAAAALAIAWGTAGLYRLRPAPLPTADFLRIPLHLPLLLAYAGWLVGAIFRGAFAVARVVLHPRLPIRPGIVRIEDRLPHPVARVTLAHSITLTPGTVTLECSGQDMVVHTLDEDAGAGLGADGGAMAARIRRLSRALAPGR